jgi:hypothetical protein
MAIPSKMRKKPETWRFRVESSTAAELLDEFWSFFVEVAAEENEIADREWQGARSIYRLR